MKTERIFWQCPSCHKSHEWLWQRGEAVTGPITMRCNRVRCMEETEGSMVSIGKHKWAVVFSGRRNA